MKRRWGYHFIPAIVATLILTLVLTGAAFSGERATREEVVAKVEEAARMIQDIGREAAIKKMTGPNHPFVWKNAHVFLMEMDSGALLAHKNQAALGFQMQNYKDAEGGTPYFDVLKFAERNDSGWKTYMSNRGGRAPLLKHLYYLKLKDENIILCSGYYPLPAPGESTPRASRDECLAKVGQAVKEINQKGLEEALKTIDDPKGVYVWKDSYVFCFNDEDGNLLAHPFFKSKGYPMIKYRDADGKQPFIDILKIAKSDGTGWKSYMFDQSGQAPRLKKTYFVLVPDKKVIVAAGYTE